MILTGETEELGEKTCPSATLSTTNPTCINPGANLGLRCERQATKSLSHDTALKSVTLNNTKAVTRRRVSFVSIVDCASRKEET
jgi:hypothetical protein